MKHKYRKRKNGRLDSPETQADAEILDAPAAVPARSPLASDLWIWAVLAAAALFTRLYDLGARVMSHDESLHAYYSWQLSQGGSYAHNPMMHGPFLFEAAAALMRIFGGGDFAARLLPALMGAVLVVALPLLLRPWIARAGAFALAGLLLVSPYVLYYSRYLRHDIMVIFFALGCAVSILSYLRQRNDRYLLTLAAMIAFMMTTLEVSFFYLAVFAVFCLLVAFWGSGFQWRQVRSSAAFDLLVVLATLGAFYSSPIALLALNPIFKAATGSPLLDVSLLSVQDISWARAPHGDTLWILLGVFAALSIAIGVWWGRLRWLKIFAVFVPITVTLYSTFFTNWSGLGTGLIGSLGYWLSQHDVARGGQPWYYYLLVFPLYEFLPIVLGLSTIVFLALRWQRLEMRVREYGLLFSLWAAGIWIALSISGEKMPWLSTHITIPFILLSALGAGMAWKALGERKGSVPASAAAGGVLAALLLLLTLNASFRVNYVTYDYVTEFVGYAHGAPGIKWLLSDAEKIGQLTGEGDQLTIAYDSANSWPLAWYMKNRPGFFGDTLAPDSGSAPMIVVGHNNWASADAITASKYYRYEIVRMWWPMEDYKGLTWERIRTALGDSNMRQALWNIIFLRDYDLYAQITGGPLDPPFRWPLEDRARVYIRKDLADQIPDLALKDYQIEDAVVLPPAPAIEMPVSAVQAVAVVSPGLDRPRALAFAPDGTVYVIDTGANRVVHLDAQGVAITRWGSRTDDGQLPPAPGTFADPWGIAAGPDGSVYVADTWNHRIQKFDAGGNFVTEWGQGGLSSENAYNFWGPRAVAVAPDGKVYVADTGNRRIAIFDADGQYLADFSQPQDIGLNEPVGIAIAPDRVLVADTWNRRVAVYDLLGIFQYAWPVPFWQSSLVENKPYLAYSPSGVVYATDPESGQVAAFDLSGNPIASLEEDPPLSLPSGVAVGPDGALWVVDSGNSRLVSFDAFR